MSTYEKHLHMSLPAAGDTDWDEEINEDLKMVGEAICPAYNLFVAPNYVDGNFFHVLSSATDRQHFNTIQGAIDYGEAEGWGAQSFGYVVHIAPGSYNENLTINGSVALVSMSRAAGGFYTGGSVLIRGNVSTLSPVILVQPTNSQTCRVMLQGITIDNAYNVDRTALSEITAADPYAIRFEKQSTTYGSSANIFRMIDCHVRMQTWGKKNRWEAGVRLDGWMSASLIDCQLGDLDYGGGDSNGYVRHLLYAYGDNAAGKTCLVNVKRCDFADQGQQPASGNDAIFYANNRATIFATYSMWNQLIGDPSFSNGGTGTQDFPGIDNTTELINYRNFQGVNATNF